MSIACSILVLTSQSTIAQSNTKTENDTIRALDELVVKTERPSPFQPLVRVVSVLERTDIERTAAKTLPDLLRYIQGADLRTRGAEGVQADLNILGGTFDQTMVFINGINFTDPQTGHHSLNIPIEVSQIERIEILHGTGAWSEGAMAYAGAINIITRNPSSTGADLSISAGDYRYLQGGGNLLYSAKSGAWEISSMAGGGYSSSTGYSDNTDFSITNAFASIMFIKNQRHRIALQAGWQHKEFGANNFYTAAYPEQFEETRMNLTSIQYTFSASNWQIKASSYHRRHLDRFELFRYDAPVWYSGHNYHNSDIAGAGVQIARRWKKAGTTILGGDYRFENILSTVLGDPVIGGTGKYSPSGIEYTRQKERHTPSVYLRQIIQLEKWRFTAGIIFPLGQRTHGGISAAYTINPYLEINGWINSSWRNPTFTDLYYKSPTQTGNINLMAEESLSGQLGLRYNTSRVKASLTAFYRYGFRIIDWIRSSGSEQWMAGNITDVKSAGADFSISRDWQDSWIERAGVSYSFLNVEKYTNGLHSLYATDYLKHRATAFVSHKIIGKLSARWDVSLQKREGSWLNSSGDEIKYNAFALADVRLMWKERSFSVMIEATNLFNKDYLYLGNLPQPGRWIKIGIAVSIR